MEPRRCIALTVIFVACKRLIATARINISRGGRNRREGTAPVIAYDHVFFSAVIITFPKHREPHPDRRYYLNM